MDAWKKQWINLYNGKTDRRRNGGQDKRKKCQTRRKGYEEEPEENDANRTNLKKAKNPQKGRQEDEPETKTLRGRPEAEDKPRRR